VRCEEVKHYLTLVAPSTGIPYQKFSHTTQEERSRIKVDFENRVTVAIEESEDLSRKNPVIILPPMIPW